MPNKSTFVRGKFVCPVKVCEQPPYTAKHYFANHLKMQHPAEYVKWWFTPGSISKAHRAQRRALAEFAAQHSLPLPSGFKAQLGGWTPANGHGGPGEGPQEPVPAVKIEDKLDRMLADLYAQRAAIDGKINTLLQLKKEGPLERGPRPEGRIGTGVKGPRSTAGIVEALAELLRQKPMGATDAFAALFASGKFKDVPPDKLRKQVVYALPYNDDTFRRLSSGAYTTRR